MQLKYRGASYSPKTVVLSRQKTENIGLYRGAPCTRAVYDTSQLAQPRYRLTYRGTEYISGQLLPLEAQGPMVATSSKTVQKTVQDLPVRSSRHQVLSELDRIHNSYLLKKLEHRLSLAKQKGDQGLINLLEKEKMQLV